MTPDSIQINVKSQPTVQVALLFVIGFDILIIAFAALHTDTPVPAIPEKVSAAAGTIISTFIGAWLAFSFAKYGRQRDQISNDITAGNAALFTLTVMWNELSQHHRTVTKPHKQRPHDWLNLFVGGYLSDTLSFAQEKLAFLFDANPEVFSSLMLEESRFHTLRRLIEQHEKLILDHAWPRMEKAGLKMNEGEIDERRLIEIVGISVKRRLEICTPAIVQHTDENMVSVEAAFRLLRSTLKILYPKAKFLDFDFPEVR